MKSLRKLTPLFRLLFALLILTFALVLLFKGVSGSINAQQSTASDQERQIENLIPKHVPIDVRIRKEKEKNWKDLKNENWARDFELEITNTGEKAIYTFYLLVFFDVPTEYDKEFIAPIYYGRPEISDPKVKATADDIPIKPGESKVFKIHPNILLSWEEGHREKGWRLPTKARIKFESLTYGDGPGLMFDQAVPYPKSSPQTSQRKSFAPPGRREAVNWRSKIRKSIQVEETTNHLPAAFLPVNYFATHPHSANADSAEQVDVCEPPCEPRRAFLGVPGLIRSLHDLTRPVVARRLREWAGLPEPTDRTVRG